MIVTTCKLFADTSTQNYFKTKTKTNREEADDEFPLHVTNPMDIHPSTAAAKVSSSFNHQEIRSAGDKDSTRLALNYRPLLTKTDSIDLDCKQLDADRFHFILTHFITFVR